MTGGEDGHTGSQLRVYLEEGRRRTFAMALDWPGWGRSGRDGVAAVESLLQYRGRYELVASAAGLTLPSRLAAAESDGQPGRWPADVEIVERVEGNSTTEYGAPGVVTATDLEGWDDEQEARRHGRLMQAAWARFDDVVAGASRTLRKGPRGGGRDLDKIVSHVVDVEPAYARKAGLRCTAPVDRAETDALRADLLRHLAALPGTARTASGWPAPYAVRRIAWHALDHAWEIEDRSQPSPADVDDEGLLRS